MVEIYYKRGYKIRYEPSSLCVTKITFFDTETKLSMPVSSNGSGMCLMEHILHHKKRIKKLLFDKGLILSELDRTDEDNIYFHRGEVCIPFKTIDFRITIIKDSVKPYQIDYIKTYTFNDHVREYSIEKESWSELTGLGKKLERMLKDNNYFDPGSGSPWDRSDIPTLYHEIFTRDNKVLRRMFDKYLRMSKVKKILL